MFFFSQFVFWNVFSRLSSWVRLRWFVFEVVEGFCNIFCLQKIIFLGGNLSEPQTVADTWARRYKQLPRNWGGGLDRNFLQLPGFYDNPSDKTALVSSNDERLTQILYETLNSVETHFWRRETSRGKVTTDVQTTATDGRDVRVSEMLVGGLERFTGQRESVLLLCR